LLETFPETAYEQNLESKVEDHMAGRPRGTDIPTLLNADILALRALSKDPPKRGYAYLEMMLIFDNWGAVNYFAIIIGH
jgi:hypothetical protein